MILEWCHVHAQLTTILIKFDLFALFLCIRPNLTRKLPKWNGIKQRIWFWMYQEQLVNLSITFPVNIQSGWHGQLSKVNAYELSFLTLLLLFLVSFAFGVGVSSILTKSIIQHKFDIVIRIEITHNISIICPDFMVASFINERYFKAYNIVQYSPENDVLNLYYAHSHFGWAEILVRTTGNWWNGCTNGQCTKKLAEVLDICNGNSYYMDIFRNKVDIWTLAASSSVGKNIFINWFVP